MAEDERPSRCVAVLIPTFRRPDSLARALHSVFAQDRADLIRDIAVVDNSNEGSARETVDALRSLSPAPLLYVHASPPGVATARNAGLAATDAPYVAFLDDDETADPRWLGAIFDVHVRFSADVTFGPVQGRAPEAAAWKRPYLERFFSRKGPETSGLIDTVYGCGNSLMTRATALKGPAPFDIAANETGGEDDRLFATLRAQDACFAWAVDAFVEEHAPTQRAKLTYTLARAVSYGQSPSLLAFYRRDVFGILKWMAVGGAQVCIYGALSILLLCSCNRRWIDVADRTARGVGKVFWFSSFHFYGQGAAKLAEPALAFTRFGLIEREGVPSSTLAPPA